jgi:hypothetical protein
MFEECPRRFYYQYYFAKMGRFPDAPEEARLALEMSRIKSLDMWAGEVVHGTIQWALEQIRDGQTPSATDARAEAQRRLSEGWRSSVKQLWRMYGDDLHPNLFEHYYSIPITPTMTDRIKNKSYLCVDNFMDSEILKRIVSTPVENWLPIEKYASFRLAGVLLYVKFDFAIRGDRGIVVYDWKSGNPTEAEVRQLACYALYASARWEVSIENVRVSAVHLQPVLDADEHFVEEEAMEEARTFISRSFSAMTKCLRDPGRNLAVMEDFPITDNIIRCPRCSFRGICLQGKQSLGDIDDLQVVDEWDGYT